MIYLPPGKSGSLSNGLALWNAFQNMGAANNTNAPSVPPGMNPMAPGQPGAPQPGDDYSPNNQSGAVQDTTPRGKSNLSGSAGSAGGLAGLIGGL